MANVALKVTTGPWVVRHDLVDLSARPVCWVAKFSAPPPTVRRSSVSSYMVDGSVDAAVAWNDRVLSITFGIDTDTDVFATAMLQLLNRTFRTPQWLEFKAGDDAKPVFFRTKATSFDEIEDFGMTVAGVRTATIDIPADPYAYGLPEGKQVLVPNDPTDRGMAFTIDDVKGDAPAPLRLDITLPNHRPSERLIVGASRSWIKHGSAAFMPVDTQQWPLEGWTVADVNDSTAIGGSRNTATVTTSGTFVPGRVTFPTMTPGDYRVLLRVRVPRDVQFAALPDWAGVSWSDAFDIAYWDRPLIPSRGGTWQWVDLGVMRLPAFSRRAHEWEPVTSSDARVRFIMGVPGGTPSVPANVSVDHAIALPAPGADGNFGRLMAAQWTFDPAANPSKLIISGSSMAAYSDLSDGSSVAWSVNGGFPHAIPGEPTTVTLVQRVNQGGDTKTENALVRYSYSPRYLGAARAD